jgi:carbon storage regulator
MLVLSRKLGEKICIGQNIFLTVVDIERGKVRLGIEAPREIPIYRQELLGNQDPPSSNSTELSAAPK